MAAPESTRNLILANAATAVFAIVFRWPLDTLLWPFWFQSVVIGWYSYRRILALKQFSTDNFTINDSPVPENEESQRKVARFFALHFGFFHVFYFFVLSARVAALTLWDWLALIPMGVTFVFTHRASYRLNLEEDEQGRPNIGTLMFLPYARVIPMHLMVIIGAEFGQVNAAVLLLFVALKTGADVVMHHVEHRVLKSSGTPKLSN